MKCYRMQFIETYDIVYLVMNMQLVEKRSNTFTCIFTHAVGGEELEILVNSTRMLDFVLRVDH